MTHEPESTNPKPAAEDAELMGRLDELARLTRAEPGPALGSRIAMRSGARLRGRAHDAPRPSLVIARTGAPTTRWLSVAAAIALLGVASVVVVRIRSRAPVPSPAETEEIALQRDLDAWLDAASADTSESALASVFDQLDAIDAAIAKPWPAEDDSFDQEAM